MEKNKSHDAHILLSRVDLHARGEDSLGVLAA